MQENLPTAKTLAKAERFNQVQLPLQDLALEETLALRSDIEYPVWIPLKAYGASATLQELLEEDRAGVTTLNPVQTR